MFVKIVVLINCLGFLYLIDCCSFQESYNESTKSWTLHLQQQGHNSSLCTTVKSCAFTNNESNSIKTRTVCCKGYKDVKQNNQTFCYPICEGECKNGHCRQPNKCICDDGYFGQNCEKRCPWNKWGKDCSNDCQCQNDALCDNKTGYCRCSEGWIGQNCEKSCPVGSYGLMCKTICSCGPTKNCNPITGNCTINIKNNNFQILTLKNSTQRIGVKAWKLILFNTTKLNQIIINIDNHLNSANNINKTTDNDNKNINLKINAISLITKNNASVTRAIDHQVNLLKNLNITKNILLGNHKQSTEKIYEFREREAVKGTAMSLAGSATKVDEDSEKTTFEIFLSSVTLYVTIALIGLLICSIFLVVRIIKSIRYLYSESRVKDNLENLNGVQTNPIASQPLPDLPKEVTPRSRNHFHNRAVPNDYVAPTASLIQNTKLKSIPKDHLPDDESIYKQMLAGAPAYVTASEVTVTQESHYEDLPEKFSNSNYDQISEPLYDVVGPARQVANL